jgi:NAD(P)H-dependent FMN reductase
MILDKPMNVCVLVVSLRKASFNGMPANALMSLEPSSMALEVVEIDEVGRVVSDGTRKFLQQFMQAFANWVETIRSQVSASDAFSLARTAVR